ncbi:MAG: SusD/RagB family nutrient-binding outer membrane lipoprotein [Agriterribacter sp.]
MMKQLKIYLLFALTTLGMFISSCSKKELDKVNFNPNNPSDVSAKFILTDMMTSTAFGVVGGDLSTYSSVYVEHEAGVWGQTFNAETRVGEPTQATTYNNSWNAIYANIKSLKIIIAKTSAGGSEEGNDVTQGIAKVLLAYNLGVLTDFFGDAPFSESGVIDANGAPVILQPKIDKQSDLYPQIQTMLDEAITLLDGTDGAGTGGVGGQDLIYGGNKGLWKKAAYGLKARYLMHTLKISTDVDGDLAKIVDNINNSFESPDEELIFNVYDGSANINPLFGYSNARDGLGVSQSLAQKFKDLNDPRGDQAFMSYDIVQLSLDDALADAAPNGEPIQQQYTYPISMAEYAYTAPTLLLSYHELMFLKAEALARLNQTEDAKDALKEGIITAFANLERSLKSGDEYLEVGATIDLSADVATTYFDNEVTPRFETNALKEIMLQKYLAFYGASGEATETFNDYRRLKAMGEADFIDLKNPLNASNKFPLRYTYGNSDVSANPSVKAAYGDGTYVYTENVWWAGGTR